MKKTSSDAGGITYDQSAQLGRAGQALAIALSEIADEFISEHAMTDPRARIAAILTAMEAMIFLTLTDLLDHDDRIPTLRTMTISLRQALTRFHQEMERDQTRDH